MKRSQQPFIEPPVEEEGVTRVLCQLAVKDGELSYWFDANMSTVQLMVLESGLRLALEIAHEALRDEVTDHE